MASERVLTQGPAEILLRTVRSAPALTRERIGPQRCRSFLGQLAPASVIR